MSSVRFRRPTHRLRDRGGWLGCQNSRAAFVPGPVHRQPTYSGNRSRSRMEIIDPFPDKGLEMFRDWAAALRRTRSISQRRMTTPCVQGGWRANGPLGLAPGGACRADGRIQTHCRRPATTNAVRAAITPRPTMVGSGSWRTATPTAVACRPAARTALPPWCRVSAAVSLMSCIRRPA